MAKHRLHCSEDWHVRDIKELKVSRLGSEPYKLSQELLEGCGVGQGLGSQSQYRLSKKATCHGEKTKCARSSSRKGQPDCLYSGQTSSAVGSMHDKLVDLVKKKSTKGISHLA